MRMLQPARSVITENTYKQNNATFYFLYKVAWEKIGSKMLAAAVAVVFSTFLKKSFLRIGQCLVNSNRW